MSDAGPTSRTTGGQRPIEGQLLYPGIAFLAAAIVGGGFKAFGIEIPLLASPVRQGLLATLGLVMVIASFFVRTARAGGIAVRDNPAVLAGLGRFAPLVIFVLPGLLVVIVIPEIWN